MLQDANAIFPFPRNFPIQQTQGGPNGRWPDLYSPGLPQAIPGQRNENRFGSQCEVLTLPRPRAKQGAVPPQRMVRSQLTLGHSGPGSLDVDGNGTADALSDGILTLRYLFDPAGAWNVADALGSGATRTARQDIKAYLDQFIPAAGPQRRDARSTADAGEGTTPTAFDPYWKAEIAAALLFSHARDKPCNGLECAANSSAPGPAVDLVFASYGQN
jgi:hypothetical protein